MDTYFDKDTGRYRGSYNGPPEGIPARLAGHRSVPGQQFNANSVMDLRTGMISNRLTDAELEAEQIEQIVEGLFRASAVVQVLVRHTARIAGVSEQSLLDEAKAAIAAERATRG